LAEQNSTGARGELILGECSPKVAAGTCPELFFIVNVTILIFFAR
jgi:hypothetical protein